jgi:hypothetical protein
MLMSIISGWRGGDFDSCVTAPRLYLSRFLFHLLIQAMSQTVLLCISQPRNDEHSAEKRHHGVQQLSGQQDQGLLHACIRT